MRSRSECCRFPDRPCLGLPFEIFRSRVILFTLFSLHPGLSLSSSTHCAPMDTLDIPTTYGAWTWGPFRLLPHYHPDGKSLNAVVVGWRAGGGGGIAGSAMNSLCVPSEVWSLRCYTGPVLLAASAATVTLTTPPAKSGLRAPPRLRKPLSSPPPLGIKFGVGGWGE